MVEVDVTVRGSTRDIFVVMEQLCRLIAAISWISTGDKMTEWYAHTVPVPVSWSWCCTGALWDVTTGGTREGTWDLYVISDVCLFSFSYLVLLMKKLINSQCRKGIGNFIQASLKFITQETVFQKALRTVPEKWMGRPVYMCNEEHILVKSYCFFKEQVS